MFKLWCERGISRVGHLRIWERLFHKLLGKYHGKDSTIQDSSKKSMRFVLRGGGKGKQEKHATPEVVP